MTEPSEDVLAVALPPSACIDGMLLESVGGADQVASLVGLHGWQAFERPLPLILFVTVRARPGLVVDVGANTGFYSVLAASASDRVRVLGSSRCRRSPRCSDATSGATGCRIACRRCGAR